MLQWSVPTDTRIRVTMLNTDKLHQYAILWQLLHCATLYLAVQPENVTLAGVLRQVQAALRTQALHQLKFFILDECDLLAPEVLSALLKNLLSQADHLHIVLVTRVPCPALLDDELVTQMRFFPEGKILVSKQHQGQWILEVNAFGRGEVISQGKLITDWQGDLTRNLFFFLLNKSVIRRDEISQAFWKHKPPQEAINLFHVTRLRLKHVLGVELLDHKQGYYRVSPRIRLIYDVTDFQELIERSQHTQSDEETIALLESAIRLYRTGYLMTLDFESAAATRQHCENDFCDALVRLAGLYVQQGEVNRATGLLARASRVQMGREDIVRRLMQIYMSQGKPADALQAYRRLEAYQIASTGSFRPPDDLRHLAAETGYNPNLPALYSR